jgi:hypothetical protein
MRRAGPGHGARFAGLIVSRRHRCPPARVNKLDDCARCPAKNLDAAVAGLDDRFINRKNAFLEGAFELPLTGAREVRLARDRAAASRALARQKRSTA